MLLIYQFLQLLLSLFSEDALTASEFIRRFCSRRTVYGILYDTRVLYCSPFYLQKHGHWPNLESLHSMPVQQGCSKIWECLIKEFQIKSGMIYFGIFIT